ncbi:15626_t:CDS:2, partial [Cetraspora pellucida]
PNDGLLHDGIMSLQWIPDSNILVSGGNDNCIRIWDVTLASNLNLMTVGVSSGKMYVYSSNETFIQA